MLISIVFDYACRCGTVNAGIMVHRVRINKGSIKSLPNDIGLGFMPGTCKSCRQPLPSTARRSVAADDLVKVNAVRARKGWPTLASGDLGNVEVVRPAGAQ